MGWMEELEDISSTSDPIQKFINIATDLIQKSESGSTGPRLCTDKRSEQRLLDGLRVLAESVQREVQRIENEMTSHLVDLRERVEVLESR